MHLVLLGYLVACSLLFVESRWMRLGVLLWGPLVALAPLQTAAGLVLCLELASPFPVEFDSPVRHFTASGAIVGILCVATIFQIARSPQASLFRRTLGFGALATITWLLLNTAITGIRPDTDSWLAGAWLYVASPVIGLAAASAIMHLGQAKYRWLQIVVVLAALSAIAQNLVVLWQFSHSSMIVSKHNAVGYGTTSGTIGMIAILIACAIAFSAPRTPKSVFPALFAVFMIPCVLLSFSRASFVGLALGFAVLLLLSNRRAFFAASIGTLTILVLWPSVSHSIWDLATAGGTATGAGHIGSWQQGAWLFSKYPLFGAGLGASRYLVPTAPVGGSTGYASTHNAFLTLAVEFGLPAGLIAIYLAVGAIREGLRGIRLKSPQTPLWLSRGLVAVTVGMLAEAMFTEEMFPSYSNMGFLVLRNTVYFWILYGIVTGWNLLSDNERNNSSRAAPHPETVRRSPP